MLKELEVPFMKTLKNILQYNSIHYYVIGLTLGLLIYKNFLFIILLILFLIKIRNNKCFKYILIFSLVMFVRGYFVKKESKINISTTELLVEVIEVKTSYMIVKDKEKFIIYDTNYKPGDIIKIKGSFKNIKEYNMPYVFNYKKYLENKNIYYYFSCTNIELINTKFRLGIIKYNIVNYINNNYENSQYYNSVLFNYNELEIKDDINRIGISHLFCISGLHISLIILFLKKFIKKDELLIPPLFIYCIIIGFTASLYRVFLVLLSKIIRDKFDIYLSDLDLLSLVYIILLIINPKMLYDISFIFTFLITFCIYLTDNKKMFFISIFLISLPISINLNNCVNLFGIITNYIFIILFETIMMPLTIITFIFKDLEFIYTYFIIFFEFLIDIFDNDYFVIDVASLTGYEMALYYGLLYFLLKSNKLYILISILLIFIKGKLIVGTHLYILDVNQGDSSIIYSNSTVVMIDCYSKSYEYVYKRGIKEIDYLFLTHNHTDHNGGVVDLSNNVHINNIVVSYYDDSDFSNYCDNVIKVKDGNIISTKMTDFLVLGPIKEDDDVNNLSLVLRFEIKGTVFLFTGDMSLNEENDLLNKYYSFLDADVLKVGHHGSKTSSSENFINAVSPKECIISVGLINSYGLPDEETIERLSNYKVYYTYDDYYYFGLYNFYKL